MREWLKSLMHIQVLLLFVVLLRLTVGVELAWQGYDKVRQGFVPQSKEAVAGRENPLQVTLSIWMEWVEQRVRKQSADPNVTHRTIRMFPFYHKFLKEIVLPHVATFAMLVTVAELGLGLALIIGLVVRVTAPLTILLCANYLLATWHLGFPYTILNVLFLVSLLVLALSGAGRCLGVDQALHERLPEIPLF